MKIITEIAGDSENRIVYVHNGTVGVLRRPSICPIAEMRRELRTSFEKPRAPAAAEKKSAAKPAPARPAKERNGKNND